MIVDYETDLSNESSNCVESVLISFMLGINMQYSHLFFQGMTFPKIEPQINMENATKGELFIEFNFIQSQVVPISDNFYTSIRKYVTKIVKRYSHYKKKEEIAEYVEQKVPIREVPRRLVLGYPINIFPVIDDGIQYFLDQKKENP